MHFSPTFATAVLTHPALPDWKSWVRQLLRRSSKPPLPPDDPEPPDARQRKITHAIAIETLNCLVVNLRTPIRVGDKHVHLFLDHGSLEPVEGPTIYGAVPEVGFYTAVATRVLCEKFLFPLLGWDLFEVTECALSIAMHVIEDVKPRLAAGLPLVVASRPPAQHDPLEREHGAFSTLASTDGVVVRVTTRKTGDRHLLCSVDFLYGIGTLHPEPDAAEGAD